LVVEEGVALELVGEVVLVVEEEVFVLVDPSLMLSSLWKCPTRQIHQISQKGERDPPNITMDITVVLRLGKGLGLSQVEQ
jgi:hypothetical protein